MFATKSVQCGHCLSPSFAAKLRKALVREELVSGLGPHVVAAATDMPGLGTARQAARLTTIRAVERVGALVPGADVRASGGRAPRGERSVALHEA